MLETGEDPIVLMEDFKNNDKDEGKDYRCATRQKANEISVREKMPFNR